MRPEPADPRLCPLARTRSYAFTAPPTPSTPREGGRCPSPGRGTKNPSDRRAELFLRLGGIFLALSREAL